MGKDRVHGIFAIARSRINFGCEERRLKMEVHPVLNVMVHLSTVKQHEVGDCDVVVCHACVGDYTGDGWQSFDESRSGNSGDLGRVAISVEDFKYATRLM